MDSGSNGKTKVSSTNTSREGAVLESIERSANRALVLLDRVHCAVAAARTAVGVEQPRADSLAHPAFGLLATPALANELEELARRLRAVAELARPLPTEAVDESNKGEQD